MKTINLILLLFCMACNKVSVLEPEGPTAEELYQRRIESCIARGGVVQMYEGIQSCIVKNGDIWTITRL